MSQLEECIIKAQRLKGAGRYSLDEIECGVSMLIAEHLEECATRLTEMTIHLGFLEQNTRD